MPFYRMMCPATGDTVVVNGRTYAGVPGTMYDVPDFDGKLLEANGWNKMADLGDGTTAQRVAQSLLPVGQGAPMAGDEFYDQTLGLTVLFDGKVWRNPASGAVV